MSVEDDFRALLAARSQLTALVGAPVFLYQLHRLRK